MSRRAADPTRLARVGAGLLALLPALAAAQPPEPDALRDLSLEQLGRIEVTTVSKQPAEVWRSPAAIFVLTADDIRRSGATTLPEVLRLVPGLQVSRLDSGHWAVGIRGLTSAFSKSLLVLIDGRSVYTPLFGGVFWQTQDTLLEDVDRIEVVRGAGGTIWGANAVNGVINVVTKDSRDTTGVLGTAGAGSVDRGRAAVRFGGRAGDAWHYRVYGTGFTRGPLSHADGSGFDDWRIAQAGFRSDGTLGAGTLTIQGDLYRGTAGDRVSVGSFAPAAQLVLTGSDRVAGGNVLARWQHTQASGAGLRVQAYYDRTEREAIHFGESRHTLDVDLLHHQPLGRRHRLSWGAGTRYSPATFTAVHPTLTLARPRRAIRLASVFLQDEMVLAADRVWLTAGSKFEHNNNSGLEIQPSARVLWRPDERQSLWAAASRAVRIPSNIDTDLRLTAFGQAAPPVYLTVAGTPRFAAERVLAFESGYRRLLGQRAYLDVTGFHNRYRDLAGFGPYELNVETLPLPHVQVLVPYENAIHGTITGVEVAPDWRPTGWLQVKAAYALLAARMTTTAGYEDESNVDLYERSSPRHQGYVRLALALPGGVELDVTHRGMSRLMAGRVPAYQTADARLEWPLARQLSLAVTAANLWQPRHVEFFRDDGPAVAVSRSLYGSILWRR